MELKHNNSNNEILLESKLNLVILFLLALDPLIHQGLRGHNLSSLDFQWQILGRVKQISIFSKVGFCRVINLTYFLHFLIFKISMREVFKNIFIKCSLIEKGSKHNLLTMKGIVGMVKSNR